MDYTKQARQSLEALPGRIIGHLFLSLTEELSEKRVLAVHEEAWKLFTAIPSLPRPPAYEAGNSIRDTYLRFYDWAIEAEKVLNLRDISDEVTETCCELLKRERGLYVRQRGQDKKGQGGAIEIPPEQPRPQLLRPKREKLVSPDVAVQYIHVKRRTLLRHPEFSHRPKGAKKTQAHSYYLSELNTRWRWESPEKEELATNIFHLKTS